MQNLFLWYPSYFKRLYYYFFGTTKMYTLLSTSPRLHHTQEKMHLLHLYICEVNQQLSLSWCFTNFEKDNFLVKSKLKKRRIKCQFVFFQKSFSICLQLLILFPKHRAIAKSYEFNFLQWIVIIALFFIFSRKISVPLTMKRKPITVNYMFMSRYYKALRVYLFVFLILQFCLSHFCNLLISANKKK